MSQALCDWCDRRAAHRHVNSEGEVRACIRHYTAFLSFLHRRRTLAERTSS